MSARMVRIISAAGTLKGKPTGKPASLSVKDDSGHKHTIKLAKAPRSATVEDVAAAAAAGGLLDEKAPVGELGLNMNRRYFDGETLTGIIAAATMSAAELEKEIKNNPGLMEVMIAAGEAQPAAVASQLAAV